MTREIATGIHWIQELGPDRWSVAESVLKRGEPWYRKGAPLHIPQNAYLFVDEGTLLFDTLSPAGGEQIVAELEELLGDRALDYLVVSHPDVPHAGNTFRILRRFPGCRLVAPRIGDTHELYHLDRAMKVGPGDEIDLGSSVLRFHEATFLDAAMSVWMTEERTRTLFTVDWLGAPIMDHEELRFADELEDAVGSDRLYEFHGRVMFWFQYADVEKVQAETRHLLDTFRPAMVAPAHGPVIRADVGRYFGLMEEVVARVAETGRIGVA